MIAVPVPVAAALIVLGIAASGSGDYEFIARWPSGEEMHACAKAPFAGLNPCEDARLGHWQPLGRPPIGEAVTLCVPHRECFDPAENFISGFNMPPELRR